MSFPNTGKSFPGGNGRNGSRGEDISAASVAEEIAMALCRELGQSGAAIKTAARWTGASERTAKNWFAGRYGPSGEHLVALVRHSDEVLVTLLTLAGRGDLAVLGTLAGLRARVCEMLVVLNGLVDGVSHSNAGDADQRLSR